MQDTLITIIVVFVIAVVFFVVPLMATANQNDEITESTVQKIAQDFVDNATKEGQITRK